MLCVLCVMCVLCVLCGLCVLYVLESGATVRAGPPRMACIVSLVARMARNMSVDLHVSASSLGHVVSAH